jgi:predicted metal-dependent peptidase
MSTAEAPAPVDTQHLITRVSKARVRLVARVPFFGYLAMQMSPRIAKPEDNVPTAGIAPDGTVSLNPEWCGQLTDKELAGVLAHEVMHPALHFWARKGTRHLLLFNIAHDLSYNFLIEEMAQGEIHLPEGVLLDPKFHGMSAEEIYNYLQKGDKGTPGKTKIKTKGGGSITIDVNGAGKCDGSCQPGGSGPPCDGSCGGMGEGEKYGDCRPDLSDTKDGQKSCRGDRAAGKRIENEWKLNLAAAAQQHEARSKTQGTLPSQLKRFIDELLYPKLDWIEQLRRWSGENGRREDYTFARPNRRSESLGVYLPSMNGGGFADITVLVDTSGSISQSQIKRFLGEISGICEEMGSEIRVMIIDAALHDDFSIEEASEIFEKLVGGGGSDFNPAFDRLEEEGYDGAVVAFTDGYIAVPRNMPVNLKGCLWLTEEDDKDPTDGGWGDHITIPKEEMGAKL